jgi:hypothetical protein
LSNATRATNGTNARPVAKIFAGRQLFGDGVEFVVIGSDFDHVKPHQLRGAHHHRRITRGESRRVRLAVGTSTEDHDNRLSFAHKLTSHDGVRECRDHGRTARHGEHIKNITRAQAILRKFQVELISAQIRRLGRDARAVAQRRSIGGGKRIAGATIGPRKRIP